MLVPPVSSTSASPMRPSGGGGRCAGRHLISVPSRASPTSILSRSAARISSRCASSRRSGDRSGVRIGTFCQSPRPDTMPAVRIAVLLRLAFACYGDTYPMDAGCIYATPDSCFVTFACKSLTCNASEEYCKLTPVGPCTLDANTCPAGQEECVSTGTGCTPDRTPSCDPLGDCTECACFFAATPCGPG